MIGQYNAFLRAVKAARGINHKEAQQVYRSIKDRTGRTPNLKDARGKLGRQESARAGKEIEKARRSKERALERSIERAKRPKEKPSERRVKWERMNQRERAGHAPPKPAPTKRREDFEDFDQWEAFDDDYVEIEDPEVESPGESAD